MARTTKKPTRPEYYWDDTRQCYVKNVRGADGKYAKLRAPTIVELRDKIRKFENERDAGIVHHSKVTVAQIGERWLPHALDGLSYQGQSSITNALNTHILPQLGGVLIKALAPSDVDALLTSMSGKSRSLQAKVLMVLRRLCKYAVENNYRTDNPCDGKSPRGNVAEEVTPLTNAQRTALLSAVHGTRAYLFCALALYAGLRREEIIGLAWDDVHLDTEYAYLDVTHSVRFDGQRPVRVRALKSDAAARRIPLPDMLAVSLREERQRATSYLVVPSANGDVCSLQAAKRLWGIVETRMVSKIDKTTTPPRIGKPGPKPIDRTLDFDCTPHKLRHTYITELCARSAETGLDIKTIQHLAGHSSPEMTLRIYAHVMRDRQHDTASKIQKIFSGTPDTETLSRPI